MSATAIVLSPRECIRKWETWKTLNHVSEFSGLAELHEARLLGLLKVTTEFCAFVDSDDELPEDTGSQITAITEAMQAAQSNLAYTDWIEVSNKGTIRKSPGNYNIVKHMTSASWMHQLVVMRTAPAQAIAIDLPIGIQWTEFLLYAQLAKTNPIYWPRIGYIWNNKTVGMHNHKDMNIAQSNSVLWYIQKGLL